jgi:hypothetical protein
MAPNAFSSYNTSELNRIISALNDTKLTLTFKLNLLRSSASSSPTHLATFDDLVDRLVDTGSQIWGLEEQNKNKESGANTGDDHEDVRKTLKSAMVLVGTLDTLGEEVMRLKFALEEVEKAAVSIGKNTLKTAGAASSQGGAASGSQSIAKAATATSLQEDIAIGASPNPADPATATHEEQRLPKSMVRAISEVSIALAYHASASSGRCSGDCWIWQQRSGTTWTTQSCVCWPNI